jgi:hypothetical protein
MIRRPSYASTVATLALVVALGGTGAYAAGLAKNSVGSEQVKNGAIKSEDVKNDGLKGKDIKEASLGTVPSAASVDSVRHLIATPTQGQTLPLLTRGSLTLVAKCAGTTPGTGLASVQMTTSVDHARWVTNNNVDSDFTVADGAAVFGPVSSGIAQVEVSAVTAAGVSLHLFGHASASGTQCRIDVVLLG